MVYIHPWLSSYSRLVALLQTLLFYPFEFETPLFLSIRRRDTASIVSIVGQFTECG